MNRHFKTIIGSYVHFTWAWVLSYAVVVETKPWGFSESIVSIRISSLSIGRTAAAALLGVLVFAGGLVGILTAQSTPQESDRFAVASIRPSGTEGRPSFKSNPGGGIQATNHTLKLLIQMAYDIRPEQLAGGPGWADLEEYTVLAKGPEGRPVLSEVAQLELTRKRLQALLSERFHLALKVEASPGVGYALTVDKKGGNKFFTANQSCIH